MNRLKNIIYNDRYSRLEFLDLIYINNKQYRIIDYEFGSMNNISVISIWSCLEESLKENNIDVNITRNGIIDHIETIDYRKKKKSYSFDYDYIIKSSDLFINHITSVLPLIDDIDFIFTAEQYLAFKTEDDYNKAYTILSLAGDYIDGNN